tara:strand:+ start:1773 stop:2819 length:1047 start_codon:yes stop_codon:yes gene_type:complete
MGLPKNYRKNLKITPTLQGMEARQHILNNIADPGTYLPKGILHEDMDRDFIDYVKNDIDLVLGGKEVPVIFLSIQRWAEFSKTWQFSDVNKNIKIPFITIVRKPDPQVGTNYAGAFNIPGKPVFTYMKIPTWDGNIKSFDVYQIPQPVSIDLKYELRLFCNKMRDLNLFNKKLLESFAAGQKYLRVNGHPIPLMLDSIGDESVISNLDERKYYVQLYTINMLGYLLDQDKFKVTPAISRGITFFETEESSYTAPYQVSYTKEEDININIQFEPSVNVFTMETQDVKSSFTSITYTEAVIFNIDSFTITVNGGVVTVPFSVVNGDDITITITKSNVLTKAYLVLKGKNT